MEQRRKTHRQIIAGVLAACMLMGLFPGLEGLLPKAEAAGTTDAYGFQLEEKEFPANDKSNPFGSAAVNGHVNFSPVKELGIFESAAKYQKNVALNLDRKTKLWLFESLNFDMILSTSAKDDHYDSRDGQLTGALTGSGSQSFFDRGYYNRMKFVRGVAYDPSGSGKDDHLVYYGYGNDGEGKAGSKSPGFISFRAKEGQKGSDNTVYNGVDSKYYEWMDRLSYYEGEGYNALVAGDFNGDGKDTIMVYDPAKGNLHIKEYDEINTGKTHVATAIEIGNEKDLKEHFKFTLNEIQTANENAVHDNTAMVHLAAGDLDGDGDDELVATISLGDLNGGKESNIGTNYYKDKGGSTASVVAVYNQSKSNAAWEMVYHTQLANAYDGGHINSGKDGKYEGWFMRSAASAIGDIDGDGSPEIVTVGLPADDLRHNDDDLRGDAMLFTVIDCGGKYSLRTIENPVKDKGGTGNDYVDHPDTIPQGWFILNSGDTGFGDWANAQKNYAENPPLSIGCVQLEGVGTTPYVFARGHIFQFSEKSGKMQFAAANNLGDTGSSKNLDRYLEGMTYVGQPVIANFDGNEQGRQQVFFVVGTRGGSDKNWIIGLTYDPALDKDGKPTKKVMDGTGLYSCDWDTNVYDRDPKYSTFVALTAPDIDTDDGLLAHYESKKHTYSEPEIMAILEASPYFEDLVDEYAETAGSTTFGTGKSTGTGTAESSSTRAGSYVSFSQEFGLFGMTIASMEMEASFEAEWSSEVAQSTDYAYEMSYETGRDYNQVLLIRTPVVVYTYEVTDPNGNTSKMDITTAEKPIYCLLPVEQYNEMARQLGDPVIGSDIVKAVPGQPDTYRKSVDELAGKNPQTLNQWVNTGGGGNSVVTQSITKSTTEEITTSLTHSFDAKAGAGAGGFTVGVSGGYSQTKAQSTTNTDSVTRSGTVSSVPTKYSKDYGFSWQFMTWDAQIDGYTVPVLSYLVKDVQQPPSLPQNVNAVAETDSVTLTWEAGFNSAEKYIVYRYLPSTGNYYYEGAVLGSDKDSDGEYSFEVTGLKPGTTYYYSLQAVSSGRNSSYTEPLAVSTASDGGELPKITKEPDPQIKRPGEDAVFTVVAKPVGSGAATYNWQVRKEGQIAWKSASSTSTHELILPNVSEDMDGNEYRCQVSQAISDSENEVFVYSKPAKLTVGKGASSTQIEAKTKDGNKNGGLADRMEETDDTQDVTKIYQVTISDESHKYHAYGTESQTPYYYCVDDSKYYLLTDFAPQQAVPDENQPDVFNGNATGRTELTNLQDALIQESTTGGAVETTQTLIARLEELHSTNQETAEFTQGDQGSATYKVFTAQGVAEKDTTTSLSTNGLTLYKADGSNDYYVDINAGRYDEDGTALVPDLDKVTLDTDSSTLENKTYFGDPQPVWSDEYDKDGEYTVLTFGDGSTKLYRKGAEYHTRTEATQEGGNPTYQKLELVTGNLSDENVLTSTPLGVIDENNVVSDRLEHQAEALAERTTITVKGQESKDGDKVTLTVKVGGGGTGKVLIKIVNTTTGAIENVAGTLANGVVTASWTPSTAGVYQITASYQGDDTTLPSTSAPATYYAYESESSGFRLELARSIPYGEAISPKLMKWSQENGTITETAQTNTLNCKAYRFLGIGAAGADADGYSTTEAWSSGSPGNNALLPGDYLIKAEWGEEPQKNVASTLLTITKRQVTIAAPKIDELALDKVNNFKLNDHRKDIQVTSETPVGILPADQTLYGYTENTGYSDLFRLTGGPRAAAGSYDIQVGYANTVENPTGAQTEACVDFISKYLPTFQKSVVNVKAETITVTYTHEPNGNLEGHVVGGTRFASGSPVASGTDLMFSAEPEPGFAVDTWTVNGEIVKEGDQATPGVELTADRETLLLSHVTEEQSVTVTFSNQTHTVTFGPDEASGAMGTVKAVSGNGGELTSGATVVAGHDVIFTAVPNANYVVKQWTVNNKVQENDDDSIYSGKTLTVDNISAATNVVVTFEEAQEYTVTFTAVDENLERLETGVELTTEGLTNGKAVKGSSVTLTATPVTGNAVQKWQIKKKEESDWTNVAGSQNSYTIQNLQADTEVRVVINDNATTFGVNFGVYNQDSSAPMEGITGGTLTAKIGNTTLTSGGQYPISSKVTFQFEEIDAYEFVKWVVNGKDVEDTSKAYTIESLTADAAVKAVVKAKPQVTIPAGTGGAVTAKAGDDDVETGSHVYNGTELIFTATPKKGYEVDEWTVNNVKNTDAQPTTTDNQTLTLTAKDSTDVAVNVTFKAIPTHDVTYSVVDQNNDGKGDYGRLTMDVKRKDMNKYEVTGDEDGSQAVYQGSVVAFHATPDAGYKIGKWIVDGQEQNAAPTLTIGEAHSVQVRFDPIGSAISYGFDPSGVTDKAQITATYKANGSDADDVFTSGSIPTADGKITLAVSDLAAGYEVEGWYINGSKQNDSANKATFAYEVTKDTGAEIQVKIIRSSYAVNFSAEHGTVTAKVGNDQINSGDAVVGDTSVTFTAQPTNGTGYSFVGWKVDGTFDQKKDQTLTLSITKPVTVTAVYKLDAVKYTVTYGVIGASGSLSANTVSKSGGQVNAGATITFTAKPAAGYQVAGWYSDAEGKDPIPGTTAEQNQYTVENLTSSIHVYVKFEPIPKYDITVNVTGLGSVTAAVNGTQTEISNGKLTVSRHDKVVLTARPGENQHLSKWTLDGVSKGNSSLTLTLDDVIGPHTVTADFAASQLLPFKTVCGEGGTLSAKAGYGDALSDLNASAGVTIEKGKTIVLTAVPSAGKMVASWKVNGEVQKNLSTTLTIESIDKETTVEVAFEDLAVYDIPASSGSYMVTVTKRTPSDVGTENQIRKGGDVTFTVKQNATDGYTNITSLTVNGYDCIANSGTVDNVTAVKNADGSYTVTIIGVTSTIDLQAEAHKVVVTSGFDSYVIPQSLIEKGLDSAEKIQTKLDTSITGSKDGVTYLDIALKYLDKDGKWVEVSEEDFPEGGLDVLLSYKDIDNDVDQKDTFKVYHMLTTADRAGDVEQLEVQNESTGIQFHVNSLSPFAISWTKYKETPVDPGGGPGGGVTTNSYTLTFDTNGGSVLEPVKKEEGTTIDLAQYVPTKEGFTFAGWYADEGLTQLVTSLKLTGDAAVYAKWTPAGAEELPFADVRPGDWFYDSVAYVYENGMMGGVSADRFAPNGTTTRGMIVTILYRLEGEPAVTEPAGFTDVAPGQWYSDAIAWAAANGVVNGMSETTFVPNGNITREQMAAILYRYAQHKGYDVSDRADLSVYTDANQVSPWAQEAMTWANAAGLINGVGSDTLDPTGSATRAQAAAIFMRFAQSNEG